MSKKLLLLPMTLALLLTACSSKEPAGKAAADVSENTTKEAKAEAETSGDTEEDSTNDDTKVNTEANAEVSEEASPAANAEAGSDKNAGGNKSSDEITKEAPIISVVDTIPAEYLTMRTDHNGTIEAISYKTKDYFGDSKEITKNAYVYLPYGYDTNKKYNVLYLMHGIGGSEKEWGMYNEASRVKIMMDNLIYNDIIEPFIIVTPNGRSSVNFASSNSDYNSFYVFGKELRNDLIPYIESKYSTYAEYDAAGYDQTKARDHRAMAGLSMGGMQTINIGMCECLDIFSYFGAFSACPTTNEASKIADALKGFPDYGINYFYNICGTEDNIALASATAAVTSLTDLTDKLTEGSNFTWQKVSGGHAFNVWYLGFYNFAQIAFR